MSKSAAGGDGRLALISLKIKGHINQLTFDPLSTFPGILKLI